MATYPTGVFSASNKGAGDVIQAAHVNDLQSEVTAIEDALKNGFAHALTVNGATTISTGGLTVSTGSVNIGGPSSVATLQVNGTSTFVGAVTFTVAPTFASGLTLSSGATVSTGVIRQNSLPCWDVFHSTFVAYGANSTAGVSFDSQNFVRGDIGHSTASNSSRVTVNTTGVYHVIARTYVSAAGNPQLTGRIVLNDVTTLLETVTPVLPQTNNSSQATVMVSGLIRMGSSGYLTFQLASENSAASTVGSSAAGRALRFSGFFVG